jgi:uncharacterized FlaG/YvyC family protein
MTHDLTKLLAKLQFYPDLQKEIKDVVKKAVEKSTGEIIDTIPVRLGYKRRAFDLQKEILNNI